MRNIFAVLTAAAPLFGCAPNLDGLWSIRASCPPQSHLGQVDITATARTKETQPGQFVGTIVNSLGGKGTFESNLEGDKMLAQTTWEGEGPTNSLLIYDQKSNSFDGIDSNGCSVRAVRP